MWTEFSPSVTQTRWSVGLFWHKVLSPFPASLTTSLLTADRQLIAWASNIRLDLTVSCDTSSASPCWFLLPDDVITLWQEVFFFFFRPKNGTSHLSSCCQTQCGLIQFVFEKLSHTRVCDNRSLEYKHKKAVRTDILPSVVPLPPETDRTKRQKQDPLPDPGLGSRFPQRTQI